MTLPPHVAQDDEPIDNLRARPWDGPDMRKVLPIEMMLGVLHQTANAASYLTLWLAMVKSGGGWVSVTITKDGEEELGIGTPCDAQIRHRSRWLHFLTEDLNEDPERRELLIAQLIAAGRYADNRPADPGLTMRAVRDFLKVGGRILIEPDGRVSEGGSLPRTFSHGTAEAAEECIRASKAYYAVRRRWRSDRHIGRAVRMLGRETGSGWWVLEADRG